jgi:hypothetical protein
MKKFFNTSGPCDSEIHYLVQRPLNAASLRRLVDERKYFVHHAPRQTGKSTLLIDFCHRLNEDGGYTALYINVEGAQTTRNRVQECLKVILAEIKGAQTIMLPEAERFSVAPFLQSINESSLSEYLRSWAQYNPKPIILVVDEIDSLVGDGLIAILRQIRSGYTHRPHAFPQSIILNGVRDLRDYRIYSRAEDTWLTGGSCFNIKAESIRLEDFSKEQVHDLYSQHSTEHGQGYETGVVDEIYRLTQGQPWLCNALGDQLCFHIGKDKPVVSMDDLYAAKEALILRRDTHIDQLYAKLEEDRIKKIVAPLIRGETPESISVDDIQYAKDLGLLKSKSKILEIANPIYQEVLPRELSYPRQMTINEDLPDYLDKGQKLNMQKLMRSFVEFYRENAHEEFFYKEITPHILLQAFLQRIINSGGRIEREYALGRKRMDLGVIYKDQKFAIEIKIKSSEKSRAESLDQIASYMDTLGTQEEGYLCVFDRQFEKTWEDRYSWNEVKHSQKTIQVIEL